MLIDVAIPGDSNVIKKEAEKILKYKDLIIEIQRMCIKVGNCWCTYKYKTYFTGEITLHVAQTVNKEQLQHYIPYKHDLFQVHNCKYLA